MNADLLSEIDLSALLAVIEAGRTESPGPAVPWAVLDAIAALIPCDEVTWCELETARRHRPLQQTVVDGGIRQVDYGDCDADAAYWELSPGFIGCTGRSSSDVTRWSDLYTPTELHNQPVYAEYFHPTGVRYALIVQLPALPGRTRRLMLRRDQLPDFSRRDVLLMQLLRPHLFEAYQSAQRRRAGAPRLTPREWQVLELAAHGYPNAEIAGLLCTTVGTVRKHMEHIFDRVGLRTRSAVVAELMLGGPDVVLAAAEPHDGVVVNHHRSGGIAGYPP